MAPEDKPRRLLSIDGGGVKGIISLCVLKTIMDDINEERKKRGDGEQKPCDVFDMICGTSTGGLIAIMLGRLGYVRNSFCLRLLSYVQLSDRHLSNRPPTKPSVNTLSWERPFSALVSSGGCQI